MRQLLVVLVAAAAARASIVLQRAPRPAFASTTLKFFGPQQFDLNASGSPLIELRAADLAAIHAKGRAPPGIEGAVVAFNYDDSPAASLEPIYLAQWGTMWVMMVLLPPSRSPPARATAQ